MVGGNPSKLALLTCCVEKKTDAKVQFGCGARGLRWLEKRGIGPISCVSSRAESE
jgi:hypothetical protein